LLRSTNSSPEGIINRAIDVLHDGDYRLVNEFGVTAWIKDGAMERSITDPVVHKIGPTPLRILGDAAIRVTLRGPLGVPLLVVLVPIPVGLEAPLLPLNAADPDDANGLIAESNAAISHRTAGRIGPILEPYERALLPLRAPPFASEITFTVAGESLAMADSVSQTSHPDTCIWPSATVYRYDFRRNVYQRTHTHRQGASPFACFISHGTPWP
jgi:hypothetical protein